MMETRKYLISRGAWSNGRKMFGYLATDPFGNAVIRCERLLGKSTDVTDGIPKEWLEDAKKWFMVAEVDWEGRVVNVSEILKENEVAVQSEEPDFVNLTDEFEINSLCPVKICVIEDGWAYGYFFKLGSWRSGKWDAKNGTSTPFTSSQNLIKKGTKDLPKIYIDQVLKVTSGGFVSHPDDLKFRTYLKAFNIRIQGSVRADFNGIINVTVSDEGEQ